jgi:GT2 family glycosyltransferase
VVVFTDDDCRPHDRWVAAAVAALVEDRVGVVWGRVLADVDATEPTGGIRLSLLDEGGPTEGALDADLSSLGHGADMAFRREVLEQVGGFDAALGVGSAYPAGEDKDVFWRAMRAGWRVRFAPAMAVTHVKWRGESEALRVMYRYGVGAGAVAAKRRRLDGTRGLVRGELVRHGLLPARRALRRGRLTRAAGALARSAGVVAGARRAGRAPMAGDHLSDAGRPLAR